MFKYYNFSTLVMILFFSLTVLFTGCVSGNITRGPQPKPLPPLKSNLPGQVLPGGVPGPGFEAGESLPKDIISQADFYALAVANGNWVIAKNMSTEANKLLLEQEVKPRLISYWRQWRVKLPPKATADFEDSQLIKENFENQLVIERMQYATETGRNLVLYLQFQITKVGDKYLVNDTLLLTTAKIFPGA